MAASNDAVTSQQLSSLWYYHISYMCYSGLSAVLSLSPHYIGLYSSHMMYICCFAVLMRILLQLTYASQTQQYNHWGVLWHRTAMPMLPNNLSILWGQTKTFHNLIIPVPPTIKSSMQLCTLHTVYCWQLCWVHLKLHETTGYHTVYRRPQQTTRPQKS